MRYVALLRGINVGGNTMMKMDELKAVFKECGFENVTSYINSGNLAFDTRSAAESTLSKKIEAAIEARFDRHVDVMLRRRTDIDEIIEHCPFGADPENHKLLHVLFLKNELPLERSFQLAETNFEGETVICFGREIYLLLPTGVAESVFSKKRLLDRAPRIPYTARNWRTVLKLADL